MERDTPAQEIHRLLHTLWSKAVGTPDYNKSEWRQLDVLLQQHCKGSLALSGGSKA